MIGPFDAPTDNARLAATTAEQAREQDFNAALRKAELVLSATSSRLAAAHTIADPVEAVSARYEALVARDEVLAYATKHAAAVEAAELAARSAS